MQVVGYGMSDALSVLCVDCRERWKHHFRFETALSEASAAF